jgi:5-methyltetrahydropteroyltriglutamate--homocysteine methyltransferase
MDAMNRLDVDVNSIENARSDNATLLAFQKIGYTKDIGPGTYDIHSPVIPPVAFIYDKLKTFLECIPVQHLVVNPDCGLKTRSWPESIGALKNMIEATHRVRREISTTGPN